MRRPSHTHPLTPLPHCRAFAATAAIESAVLLSGGRVSPTNLALSQQELVDCVNSYNGFYSNGCNGGA